MDQVPMLIEQGYRCICVFMFPSKEVFDKAIAKVQELLAIDMGSLVQDKKEWDGQY